MATSCCSISIARRSKAAGCTERMTKLDLVLARIRQLPPEQQEAFAEQIEFALNSQGSESVLTDEEWAEIEPTLDDDQAEIPHEQVVAEMRAKYGE